MMVFKQMIPFSTVLLLLSFLPGVRGEYTVHLAGLVVACSVAFLLFIVVILMLVVVLTWNSWFPAIQRSKGKVKMPKSYWQKKEEAKMKLLNTSRGSRMTSSTVQAPAENRMLNGNAATINRAKETASWVQGWNNTNPANADGYEELILTMDLGEEKEEPEFRIETSLVDNETLDLDPFKASDTPRADPQTQEATTATTTTTNRRSTAEQTLTMDMGDEEDDEDLHTPSVDRPRQVSSSQTPPPPPPPPPPADEDDEDEQEDAVAVAVGHPLFCPPPKVEDEPTTVSSAESEQQPMSYSQFVDSSMVAF